MAINLDEQGRPWTISGGGPVIVLPAESAAAWRGTEPPLGAAVPPGWTWGSAGGPECDYDRACAPQGFMGTPYGGFGWLDVGGKPALLLDAEIVTVWLAEPGGGTIVRAQIEEASRDPASIGDGDWKPFPAATVDLADGRLFMFDSAFPGAAQPEAIAAHDGVGVITLEPGRWSITCASSADEVDFIRFRRAP